MSLFNWGDFTLHSGQRSNFKIDCDALTPADWKALAKYALIRLPRFRQVEGVPTGGLLLASFLSEYVQPEGVLLIVDDVLTTGLSMEYQRAGREAAGLVVFARCKRPAWVGALFTAKEL